MKYVDLLREFGADAVDDIALIELFMQHAGIGIVSVKEVFDESLLRGALLHIPAEDYKIWIDVAISLKSAAMEKIMDETVAYDFFLRWSETANNFDEKICENKWRGINPTGIKGLGSIYYEAKENGWKGQRHNYWTIEERKAALWGESI